jgi:hypothetical protein
MQANKFFFHFVVFVVVKSILLTKIISLYALIFRGKKNKNKGKKLNFLFFRCIELIALIVKLTLIRIFFLFSNFIASKTIQKSTNIKKKRTIRRKKKETN